MGEALLDTLQRVFPYTVKLSSQSQQTRSIWCTEKVHSILHGSHNLRRVGRSRNITCQVTESRLKALKAKGHMTNRNPDTYGMSIMRAEVRECCTRNGKRGRQQRYVLYCIDAYWHVPRVVFVCSVMYLYVLVCIWFVLHSIWLLFR